MCGGVCVCLCVCPTPIPTTCMKLLVLLVCNLLAWRVGETGSDAPEKLSALAPGGNWERGLGGGGWVLPAAELGGGNWFGCGGQLVWVGAP